MSGNDEEQPNNVTTGSSAAETEAEASTETSAATGQSAATASRKPEHLQFEFTGTGHEYFGIWLSNSILTVLTLGIYSAWAKVRRQSFFYRATSVGGASFEYLADPIKILKGRIVIAVALVSLSLAAEFSPWLYAALALIYFGLTPFFLTMSLRFNARNSAYRNLHFSFRGRVSESYRQLALAGLISLFSFGIGYPYARWRLQKYVLNHHRFGSAQLDYQGLAADFFFIYLKAFMAFSVVALAGGALSYKVGGMLGLIALPAFYLCAIAFYGFIKGAISYHLMSHLKVGKHTLHSTQTGSDVALLYLTNALAIVFTFGLYTPWAQIRLARYRAEHTRLTTLGNLEAEVQQVIEQEGAIGEAAIDLGDFDFDFGF